MLKLVTVSPDGGALHDVIITSLEHPDHAFFGFTGIPYQEPNYDAHQHCSVISNVTIFAYSIKLTNLFNASIMQEIEFYNYG